LSHAIDDLRPERNEGQGEEEHMAPYESFAHLMGKRLGEMHAILAQPSDDPAFAPGTAGAAEIEDWTAHTERLLTTAFDIVAARKEWEGDAEAHAAKALLDRRKAIGAAVHKLARAARDVPVTRIHGDFHLGQVLVASGDAFIIDFEGEPTRPVEMRRAKSSPMRDVAGMLRSFDYAAAMSERKGQSSQAHVAEASRNKLFDEFRRRAAQCFLAGYREVVGDGHKAENAALDLFLIEKAAYEIGYEAASRPAWLRVPVMGLSAIVDRVLAGAKRG
jgi:maltose alpha-D-glucosyltransferase/alpha-amylase